MYKIFCFAIILMITTSCNEQEQVNQIESDESKIKVLNQAFDQAVNFSFSNLNSQTTRAGKNTVNFNQRESIVATIRSLDGRYFIGKSFNYNLIGESFSSINLPDAVVTNSRVKDLDINNYSFYSDDQKELARPFLNLLVSVNDLKQVSSLSSDFNKKISNSKLNGEEKLALFALSAVSNSTAKYLASGGVDVVYSALSDKLNLGHSGRIQDCSVNWRNVWLGAVVGLGVGAGGGLKIGCAGGTVAFPGLGTATGCVGGAVIGGATGFIGGAATSVASELLGSCFR